MSPREESQRRTAAQAQGAEESRRGGRRQVLDTEGFRHDTQRFFFRHAAFFSWPPSPSLP